MKYLLPKALIPLEKRFEIHPSSRSSLLFWFILVINKLRNLINFTILVFTQNFYATENKIKMREMVNYKRFLISTLMGAVLGVVCILGVGMRIPGTYLDNIVYLMGIWSMRVLLGMTIGLAEGIVILKGEQWKKWVNVIIRGILFGLVFSTTLVLIDPFFMSRWTTFAAGIAYGPIIDLIATWLGKKKE